MGLSPTFLADLRAIAGGHHVQLSRVFDQLRSDSSARLNKYLDDLDGDDPIRLSVTAFGMIDYGRLETAYTRALKWLLTPSGSHGFGNSVLDEVLSLYIGEGLAKKFALPRVDCERRINLKRSRVGRVDVWIEGKIGTKSALVIVEAKIDSVPSQDQLDRYKNSIEQLNFERKFYVIMAPGVPKVREWKFVSFSKLARAIWRGVSTKNDAPGYHFARYYVAGLLTDVLHWPLPVQRSTNRPIPILSYLESEN
jgi:hypothetical protein